jgi:hypothetical protein
LVAAFTDLATNYFERYPMAKGMERVYPRHCMLVDRVDKSAIHIEEDSLRRSFLTSKHTLIKRPALKRCFGVARDEPANRG